MLGQFMRIVWLSRGKMLAFISILISLKGLISFRNPKLILRGGWRVRSEATPGHISFIDLLTPAFATALTFFLWKLSSLPTR